MSWGTQFTVGMEEELLLVDPQTLLLADVAEDVVRRVRCAEGHVGLEAHAHEIELRSLPAATAAEAAGHLAELRGAVAETGTGILGSGLHPAGELFDARLTAEDRYAKVLDQMRGLIGRTPECALHVHVGAPDREAAIRMHNGLRAHVPLLTALAANSPFWFGRDSGLASARWAIVRGYPRHRIPPYFHDYDHYEEHVAAVCEHGDFPDYTHLWWDVRLHPRVGTVELREMDAQADLASAAALAEAVQILGTRAAEADAAEVPTEALAESSFRAARDGVLAELRHEGSLRPVAEIARELIGTEGIERILATGGGARLRRAAHARGGMREVLEDLAAETAEAFEAVGPGR